MWRKLVKKAYFDIDPGMLAGIAASGKIMANNALSRFGHHIPLVQKAGSELMGIGYRNAQKGRELPSPLFRNSWALIDPHSIDAMEMGHSLGKVSKDYLDIPKVMNNPLTKKISGALGGNAEIARGVIANIPTESTGVRAGLDYMFAPMSEVRQDIINLVRPNTKIKKDWSDLNNTIRSRDNYVFKPKEDKYVGLNDRIKTRLAQRKTNGNTT